MDGKIEGDNLDKSQAIEVIGYYKSTKHLEVILSHLNSLSPYLRESSVRALHIYVKRYGIDENTVKAVGYRLSKENNSYIRSLLLDILNEF